MSRKRKKDASGAAGAAGVAGAGSGAGPDAAAPGSSPGAAKKPASRWGNLALRFATAAVLLPAVLWLLWKGGYPSAGLVGFAAGLVAFELYGIVGLPRTHPAALLGIAGAASLSYFALDVAGSWPAIVGVLVAAPIVGLGLVTLDPPDGDLGKAAPLAAFAAVGPAYAGLCLGSVVALRHIPGEHGFDWVVVALTVTWGNDTGAYLAGRFLGKHKLYERVSPNKTWEGFVGGVVAAIGGCFIVQAINFPELRIEDCVLVGLIASVLGPIGDLAESMLKRAYGVKDSGKLLAGHGGMFDRVDALLFNAPWVYVYAVYLQQVV